MNAGAIGVFDSGFGGLAVLREIVKAMPNRQYIYLGDTARAPYGSRPQETVLTFTRQGIDFLFDQGCELVVVACNTASAEALPHIQQNYLRRSKHKGKRVLGVIIPTLEHVAHLTDVERIGLIGTESTIASGSFERELKKISRHDKLFSIATPLLVPLIESGESDKRVRKVIVEKYLKQLLRKKIDTLILGCTHYGHLERDIKKIVGKKVRVISEGPIVALKLKDYLKRHPEIDRKLSKQRRVVFYTTDISSRFETLGKLFYGKNIKPKVAHLEKV